MYCKNREQSIFENMNILANLGNEKNNLIIKLSGRDYICNEVKVYILKYFVSFKTK